MGHTRDVLIRGHHRALTVLASAFMMLGAAACTSDAGDGAVVAEPSGLVAEIEITSPAFAEGDPIPEEHTCDGDDTLPTLSWSEPPEGTATQAVVVDDPDAPDGTFTHWTVANLPSDQRMIEGAAPEGAVVGENDFGTAAWRGPCPPPDDEAHRYRFTLVALDTQMDVQQGFAPTDLAAAMSGHVVGQGTLTGTYDR